MPCCLSQSKPVAVQLCYHLHLDLLHSLRGLPPWAVGKITQRLRSNILLQRFEQLQARCSAFVSSRLQELYLHKSLTSSAAHWYPQTCSCWGTSPASASWLRGSCRQGRPSCCCRLEQHSLSWFVIGSTETCLLLGGAHQCVYFDKHHWTVRL